MKLKKLIVSGFKSFADRTEFEFDEGISCVVGPNGCGKSNVVDAIKWVLGEQSAKSLRGGEMMDVIFNGSASRKASGCTEVTLVFDNSEGQLKLEGQEPTSVVSVSRRLFRSGQSEYLINKAPARLRDVREMFMDTGVGVDAYGVIEQGRVESFLQANHEDRRAIFDEAAGISKYKARKKEAIRKLERVEQNLLRVNDILAEVEKRLRSIKLQAGKARSYQSYSERLKELRGLHFLAQYHGMCTQRAELEKKLNAANDNLATVTTMLDQLESARSAAEAESADLERTGRELGARISTVAAQIETQRQRADMLAGRVRELGEQIVAASARCEELEAKIEKAGEDLKAGQIELQAVQSRSVALVGQYDSLRGEHNAGELAIAELHARLEDEKAGTIDLLRRTAQLHNEIHASQIRQESLTSQQVRLNGRKDEIVSALEEALTERAVRQERTRQIAEVLSASRAKLEEIRQASRRLIDGEHRLQNELAAARENRSAVQSRMETLREMLDRLEGVSTGTRKVLEARRDGRFGMIRGMLGDFINTEVAAAGLVEAALAGADQQLVVQSFAEVQSAAEEMEKLLGDDGAVEILCLDRMGAPACDFDASSCPDIEGRLIDLVRFEPFLAAAMRRLLGLTFVVADLAAAERAAAVAPPGSRFVTRSGQVVEAGGLVRLGLAKGTVGMIARRSELAELSCQADELNRKIDELTGRCQATRGEIDHHEQLAQQFRTAIYEANTERVENDSRLTQVNEQIERLEREKPLVAADLARLGEEIASAVAAEATAKTRAAEVEQLNAQRQAEVQRLTSEIASARQHQDELAARLTELKVAIAQAEAKVAAIKDACATLVRSAEQMAKDLSAARGEIELNTKRRDDAELAIAAAVAEVGRLHVEQEALAKEAAEVEESRQSLSQRLEEIRRQIAHHRASRDEAASAVSAIKLEAGENDVRIENLITRAADEMNMSLTALYGSYRHDENRDWNAVAAEIADLRGRIERLGNVNLDAIAEQDELEKRREFLSTQLDDVTASREALADLIRRINKESRQLFIEMFEKVRGNFHELFRKLFGGGRADIMLLDAENVLECGIEIVARPPGKETRTLSLLSGGEKTLTALALLFAIFKSRPSPFCLLDEVDAALDEANIQRFTRLVREFVDTSQFLIITHAKRTMSMANVLYGVTMQEPGVSKRISVRFEDAGHKLTDQLQPIEA